MLKNKYLVHFQDSLANTAFSTQPNLYDHNQYGVRPHAHLIRKYLFKDVGWCRNSGNVLMIGRYSYVLQATIWISTFYFLQHFVDEIR